MDAQAPRPAATGSAPGTGNANERRLGADEIQLSAALHPSEADVPPEAMLDPVANTLDLRKPFDRDRARRVEAAVTATGTRLADVAYFDNLLHHDAATRRKKHDFLMRVFDAAVLLGVDAVCGFVGRNQQHSMDENLLDFEAHFVPLLKEAKARKLTYRVEQCPMPGWNVLDRWHNNIAYAPGPWIALHRICERHGVGDQFRIHYDPSHAILMGQDTRSMFNYLKDEGYGFLIGGFHVKGQVADAKGIAAWGYGGQTLERGDWVAGKVSTRPADHVHAWKKQVVLAEHELPGTARHDPLAVLLHALLCRRIIAVGHGETLRDHDADASVCHCPRHGHGESSAWRFDRMPKETSGPRAFRVPFGFATGTTKRPAR